MIKDVMMRLDATVADEIRLRAADDIAGIFGAHVIGLFVNVIPFYPIADLSDPLVTTTILEAARANGDKIATELGRKLEELGRPTELRRIDAIAENIGLVAASEARSADVFVAIRPGKSNPEPRQIAESVLFESGRHLVLISGRLPSGSFERILLAWNGSRESTRAMAEALPYLLLAKTVTIVVVGDGPPVDGDARSGSDAKNHLHHHGIKATLRHAKRNGSTGATLIEEAKRMDADLIVMGGYGHSRLHEWLLGGATRELLNNAPVPLLIAH
jgi:nucleotide-binding universal stress UspA family protein